MILRHSRPACTVLAIAAAGLAFTGCVGPTYGTGKTQGQQLFEDLDNIVTLDSSGTTAIAYTPRPELVKPADTSLLPPPREATAAGGDWPESPEARRQRLQQEAFKPDDRGGTLSVEAALSDKEGLTDQPIGARGTSVDRQGSATRDRDADHVLAPSELDAGGAAFRERIKESYGGGPAQRRYLSEPPIAYRQPSAAAPVGDPGEDEDDKQRRLGKGDGSFGEKLRDLLPF